MSVVLELLVACHEESHDGYCSGSECERVKDSNRTLRVLWASDQPLLYDPDAEDAKDENKLDLEQFRTLNERLACAPPMGSGYCNCHSTYRVLSARLVPDTEDKGRTRASSIRDALHWTKEDYH